MTSVVSCLCSCTSIIKRDSTKPVISEDFLAHVDSSPAVNVKCELLNRIKSSRSVSLILGSSPPLFSLWHSAGKAQQARAQSDLGDYLLRPFSKCLTSFLKHPSFPGAGSTAAPNHRFVLERAWKRRLQRLCTCSHLSFFIPFFKSSTAWAQTRLSFVFQGSRGGTNKTRL